MNRNCMVYKDYKLELYIYISLQTVFFVYKQSVNGGMLLGVDA